MRLGLRPLRDDKQALFVTACAALVAACLITRSPCAARAAEVPTAAVDAIFAQWDKPDSPGCALAVIRDGETIYERGYGSANLDYEIPIREDSAFYLASVSKQFTAAAIAMLALEGRLSLDDDVRKFVPELPDYGDTITVRHLVYHTSGLRDYLALMSLAGIPFENLITNEEILELIARQKELNFRPGDEYLYSNTGYFLMGVIVGRVTGTSLREYTEDTFFAPLGMKNTHFHDDATQIVKNRVTCYAPFDDGFRINYPAHFDNVGSGGLYSTSEDLALWDQNFYEKKIGGQPFIDLMRTRGKLNNGTKQDYAFGLNHAHYKGLAVVEHGGSLMGFRTQMTRFPEKRFSVICLANLGNINPRSLVRQVSDLYLSDEIHDALAPYAGSYVSEELPATRSVELEGTDLVLVRGRDSRVTLEPTTERDKFVVQGAQIEFTRDDSDHINGVMIQAGRVRNLRFSRRESP